MKTVILTCGFLLSIIHFACDPNSPLFNNFSPPKCEITKIEYIDYQPGQFARMNVTAINSSNSNAFGVACEIKLKNGNTIIQRRHAFFGTLQPGEAALDDAKFSKISTHNEYDYAEIKLYWLDENNQYYEKFYL